MPYNTVTPENLISGFVQWMRDEQPAIDVISTRAGGWEGWAAPQFAYWLGTKLGNQNPIDLDFESEVTTSSNADVDVYEDASGRADLVFNALTSPGDAGPPVIVVELKFQRVLQTRSKFRAGLQDDLAQLEEVSDDLRDLYQDRGVVGLSLGVCFPTVPVLPGYQTVPVTRELVLWWQYVQYTR